MSAVERLRADAERERQRGNGNLAELFDQKADAGEEAATDFIEMRCLVGRTARRIRQKEGW